MEPLHLTSCLRRWRNQKTEMLNVTYCRSIRVACIDDVNKFFFEDPETVG